MKSHSVTSRHMTQVIMSRLNPSQTDWYLIYLSQKTQVLQAWDMDLHSCSVMLGDATAAAALCNRTRLSSKEHKK